MKSETPILGAEVVIRTHSTGLSIVGVHNHKIGSDFITGNDVAVGAFEPASRLCGPLAGLQRFHR